MTSQDIQEEFQQLADLLELEKQAAIEQFRKKIDLLSLKERVDQGYAWYPVEVQKSGYTHGSRAFVILLRGGKEEPDHFRAGKLVRVFTQQPEVKKPEVRGVIQYADRRKMKIILNQKDLPDWMMLGKIGVDLLFDERPYVEMEKAIEQVRKARGNRLAELRDVLYGKLPAYHDPHLPPVTIPHLNDSQNDVVDHIRRYTQVSLIHGPPGTGKTTTLVAAIKQICKSEATVLVCAPSNTATDLLAERLDETGLRVVRLGNISRIDERIISLTLDDQLAKHPEAKTIKKVKIEAAELRRQAKRYRRQYGREQARERGQLFKQAGQLDGWARQLEQRLIDQLLDGAQVIVSTLVGTSSALLGKRQFPTVFIDEAAQALEPATWIPILRAGRVVLAGDPRQLPPTVHDKSAARMGLNVTLLEKGLRRNVANSLLRVQYRMNETIMSFSNHWYYEDQLIAHASVADSQLAIPDNTPLILIDTAGTDADELVEPAHQSRYNPREFEILREHLYQIAAALQELPTSQESSAEPLPSTPHRTDVVDELPSIALISPYREQVEYMKQQLATDVALSHLAITVQTIDGFQGQERDIVIISLVRSNDKGEIGFLKDYRRMNVAMTRAKKQLIVVGDSATIGNDKFYEAFLEHVERVGDYRSAWTYMA